MNRFHPSYVHLSLTSNNNYSPDIRHSLPALHDLIDETKRNHELAKLRQSILDKHCQSFSISYRHHRNGSGNGEI